MTISFDAHKQFFQKTSNLANELKTIENQVKAKEQSLIQQINSIGKAVTDLNNVKQAQPNAIQVLTHTALADMQNVLTAWENKIANYEKGLAFREKFGDSLMIFVYGKVKAGKSSLGNFIATGTQKPDGEHLQRLAQQLHAPQFFLHEQNNNFAERVDHSQGFQVGAAETTSCIQGFTVPGLTWVDSPGLHSMHDENGELAKKYVESADLIIYPMSSAQPGRETDQQELRSLLKAGKRILLLITRADGLDEDEVDGKIVQTLVMMSEAGRSEQQNYVEKAFVKDCHELGFDHVDTSALSISVAYAEANNNSFEAMQESGMQSLFDKLSEVLQSEGIALKKQVPEKNLKAFYQVMLSPDESMSILHIINAIENALKNIGEQEKQLDDLGASAYNKVVNAYAFTLDALVEQYASNKNIGELQNALQKSIETSIEEHYAKPLNAIYESALRAGQSLNQSIGLCAGLSFENKTLDIEIDVSGSDAAIGSGVGGVGGAAIGFFFGGPPGAAIGGILGSFLGRATAKFADRKTLQTIVIGDNREDIKHQLLQKGEQIIKTTLDNQQQVSQEQFIQPIKTALQQTLTQTNKVKRYIEAQ